MHQQLNLRRFGLLLRLDFAENGRSYLLTAGLIITGMLLLMLPVLVSREYSEARLLLHALALFMCVWFGGSLFTSTVFSQYGSPSRGVPALMLPASRLEKFGVSLLVNLFFTVLFIVLFRQLHHWFIEAANERLPVIGGKYRPIPSEVITVISYGYFLTQGAMFLGSIYFPKNAYLKTAVALLVVTAATTVFHLTMVSQLTGNPRQVISLPFTEWRIFHEKMYLVAIPSPVDNLVWVFLVFLVVALWAIAWVRLKEKEI